MEKNTETNRDSDADLSSIEDLSPYGIPMSDFETYAKRNKRMKALEAVLSASKALIASASHADRSERIRTLYELQKAIEDADKCPPPHLSMTKE